MNYIQTLEEELEYLSQKKKDFTNAYIVACEFKDRAGKEKFTTAISIIQEQGYWLAKALRGHLKIHD